MFNLEAFCSDFLTHIESSREKIVENKTPNAVDTLRVFEATDAAVKKQPYLANGTPSYHGNKKGDGKEFLCDYTLCLSDEIILCLESEWGKLCSAKGTSDEVVFDFKKLLCMLAPLKIMVFSYTDAKNEIDILNRFSELLTTRAFIAPKEQFIVFSTPWHDEMNSQTMKCYYWHGNNWSIVNYGATGII